MQERQENFDYDIIPGRFVMSLAPRSSCGLLFGSDAAKAAGSSTSRASPTRWSTR